jgi:hypothetical protein
MGVRTSDNGIDNLLGGIYSAGKNVVAHSRCPPRPAHTCAGKVDHGIGMVNRFLKSVPANHGAPLHRRRTP